MAAGPAPVSAPPLWRWTGRAGLAATLVLAFLYAWAEVERTGGLRDGALIALVAVNAAVVYRFGFHVAPKAARMLGRFPPGHGGIGAILGHPAIPPGALAYAALVAGAGWVLNPWPGDPDMRLLFTTYLLAGNITIGMGVTGVILYWRTVLSALPRLDLRLLNLSHPPLPELLRVNSEIVMTAAVVASLAILAVVLSGYEIEAEIIAFSIFALLMVMATYAVPILPLANRLNVLKVAELDRIERLIEAHLRRLTGQDDRPDLPQKLPALETLIEARDMVAAIRTLPPGGQVSVSATAIVAFLSFLPTLIDYAMDKLL